LHKTDYLSNYKYNRYKQAHMPLLNKGEAVAINQQSLRQLQVAVCDKLKYLLNMCV